MSLHGASTASPLLHLKTIASTFRLDGNHHVFAMGVVCFLVLIDTGRLAVLVSPPPSSIAPYWYLQPTSGREVLFHYATSAFCTEALQVVLN